jgi:hypothetical protein
MLIKNIKGTTGHNCVCGSWLKHWENFSDQTSEYCQAEGCTEKDPLGAHAQKAYSKDEAWYIYPLCKTHNQHLGELDVSAFYKLVPANIQDGCAKNNHPTAE